MDNQIKLEGAFIGRQPTDFAGGTIPFEVRVPDSDWNKPAFLPTGEKQYGTNGDKLNCVTQSEHNDFELQLNQMIDARTLPIGHINWLSEKGYKDENGKPNFSEKFNSILNDTAKYKGNWLWRVADDAKHSGLIPQSMLPEKVDEDWDTYYNPAQITQEMKDLGQEFLEWFDIAYEWVDDTSFENLVKQLQHTPLQVVFPNHAVVQIKSLQDLVKYYDSYQPWVKDKDRDKFTSFFKIVITPKVKKPELAKILKDADGKAVGVCVLARNPEELIAMAEEAGFPIPRKSDGSLDWNNFIQGDYKLR